MSQFEILPEHFKGTWTVVASRDAPAPQLKIFEKDGGYHFQWDGGREHVVKYDPLTDNIHISDEGEDICISFWRQTSMDHIFARSRRNRLLWGACRHREEPNPDQKKTHEKICREICGKWDVKLTTGKGTPAEGSAVVIARAGVQLGDKQALEVPRLALEVPRLFYLFEVKKSGTECYDVLTFESRTVTFNSIFRVRTINYWSNDDREKMIFAMFDNRFSLPVGHFGASPSGECRLGGLLSFERAAQVAENPTGSSEPSPIDPNTGCWTGNGG